ncbi:type VI secretion system contractile sheath small subunit [Pseudomonas fluorescens]|uniref:Uncharacterized protein n=1 Tax=Pseudomonas fluorescens TaxID=294 RepID=A0A5E7C8F6_PSEFL|nr:type VI secretion system contractile sheath small subunit [Pseudomonas fluorescens]VVO00556.1 hypothetical protein PS691_02596 [Pseudomonas fluorescens]
MPEDDPLSAQPRHAPQLREGNNPLACQTLLPLPQLNKLRELRNALVALKGPLAEKPGLRERIEWGLFNNEANDRMLGKVVCRPLDLCQPSVPD